MFEISVQANRTILRSTAVVWGAFIPVSFEKGNSALVGPIRMGPVSRTRWREFPKRGRLGRDDPTETVSRCHTADNWPSASAVAGAAIRDLRADRRISAAQSIETPQREFASRWRPRHLMKELP
jgi:hypothetical protein